MTKATSCSIQLRLEIEPVDSLFFRDARPFEPASRGESGLPMPQTLTGAVRTLLLEQHGVDFGRLGTYMKESASFAQALAEVADGPAGGVAEVWVRGPWFTLNGEVLVPVPASLRREKTELEDPRKGEEDQKEDTRSVFRLDPLKSPLPGWRPELPGMRPLWRYGRETTEAADGFLKLSGLRRFLEGGVPKSGELVPKSALYDFDDRTGIGVDPKRNTAAKGELYGIRMLALKREAGLYAEVRGPADTLKPLETGHVLMKFGGEGRHVVVRNAAQGAAWPDVQPADNMGRLVLLTTPAYFNGWRPPSLEPVAAAVGGFQAVSGWNLAKGGPKPNRFMVPAGSVYFLPPGAQIPTSLLVDGEDAQAGWGCFLEGNWHDV